MRNKPKEGPRTSKEQDKGIHQVHVSFDSCVLFCPFLFLFPVQSLKEQVADVAFSEIRYFKILKKREYARENCIFYLFCVSLISSCFWKFSLFVRGPLKSTPILHTRKVRCVTSWLLYITISATYGYTLCLLHMFSCLLQNGQLWSKENEQKQKYYGS